MKLCLASASPARAEVLTRAGIAHEVAVSNVDEEALLAELGPLGPADEVLALARAKAEDVAATGHSLVIGCDSMFEYRGEVYGKPHTREVARERLSAMSGGTGVLHTGHWLITPTWCGGAVSQARVTIASLSEREIEEYIDTGEPLEVAGCFTIDGMGGPFISSIEGDHHGIIGLSLPLLRELLIESGHSITELWNGR